MMLPHGALAAGLGCCIVSAAVASGSLALAVTAPPLTAAALWVAAGSPRSMSAVALWRRRNGRPVGRVGESGDVGGRGLLEARAADAAAAGHRLTLLSVRLGGLDAVGDSLGAPAREEVLASAVSRIMGCLRSGDTTAALSADELAILLPASGDDHGLLVADLVLEQLRRPVTVDGVSVVTRGSIGVAAGRVNLDELLQGARLAMRQAVDAGGDRVSLYHRELLHEAQRRIGLESELRAALAGGELCVYYQPIVDAPTGRVRSVEALVRWNHPRHGLLAPPSFLAAAEHAGLMLELGRQVLELACGHLAEWRERWPELAVAVNVSQAELVEPEFAQRVLATLRRTGLPTSALHLEVTETVSVVDDTIATTLQPLVAAGVACSLDDFGTGHSSLRRLRQVPVARLKIDKSFVAELGTGQRSSEVLASVISLAHSAGHRVVAEGVETPEQAAFLTARGCDELQGYLYSRPVPADEVPGLLASVGALPVGRLRS